ncbi:hypothetical protein G6F68_011992 [Rhizopus microsporus]|nr:hypothetical protein G6F68_011992 [Rhizopus microsporus]
MPFGDQPAGFERLRVGVQFIVLAIGSQGVEGRIGAQHAGLDRGVAALDAADVEVAGLAADQCATGEHRLRQRHQATGGDGARAVTDAGATFQVLADGRVGLEALEFLERAQPRVLVVQADHVADGNLAAVSVVQERAAIGVVVQRPAGGVHHQARLMLGRVDLPQLLDADAVGLRVLAFVQLVTGDQLAAEVAARAFSEDRVLGLQRHATLEGRADAAVLLDAHVAGGYADHFTVVAIQHLGGGEAGEDRHFQRLGLLRQPTAARWACCVRRFR